MSLAAITAQLLREAGVSADDILREAGVDREGAVKLLADSLGVELVDPSARGDLREIDPSDVAKIREALPVLNRAFS